jgi:hypothetical protein
MTQAAAGRRCRLRRPCRALKSIRRAGVISLRLVDHHLTEVGSARRKRGVLHHRRRRPRQSSDETSSFRAVAADDGQGVERLWQSWTHRRLCLCHSAKGAPPTSSTPASGDVGGARPDQPRAERRARRLPVKRRGRRKRGASLANPEERNSPVTRKMAVFAGQDDCKACGCRSEGFCGGTPAPSTRSAHARR